MLNPDIETRRQLVRERHAELQHDAVLDALTRPVVVESRKRRRRLRLKRLWFNLRPAGEPS